MQNCIGYFYTGSKIVEILFNYKHKVSKNTEKSRGFLTFLCPLHAKKMKRQMKNVSNWSVTQTYLDLMHTNHFFKGYFFLTARDFFKQNVLGFDIR